MSKADDAGLVGFGCLIGVALVVTPIVVFCWMLGGGAK